MAPSRSPALDVDGRCTLPILKQPPPPLRELSTADERQRERRALLLHVAPPSLATLAGLHPCCWSKADVHSWLRWCSYEYSLAELDLAKFSLNGKALMLLKKEDFMERAPYSGDVLYNTFQLLLRRHKEVGIQSNGASIGHVLAASHQAAANALLVASRTACIVRDSHHSATVPHRFEPEVRQHPDLAEEPVALTTRAAPPSHHLPSTLPHLQSTPLGDQQPMWRHSALPPQQRHQATATQLSDRRVLGISPKLTKPQAYDSSAEQQLEAGSAADQLSSAADETSGSWLAADCRLLWEFISRLLADKRHETSIRWEDKEALAFRIVNPAKFAHLWGLQKNRGNMTYEKLSRALRYYYKMNIMEKIPGKRLTYRFLRPPAEIKQGRRGQPAEAHARSRQSSSASASQPQHQQSGCWSPERTDDGQRPAGSDVTPLPDGYDRMLDGDGSDTCDMDGVAEESAASGRIKQQQLDDDDDDGAAFCRSPARPHDGRFATVMPGQG